MAIDDPSILPDALPPRPAARESAVEAAMRRFDGAEGPVPSAGSPPPRRAWASHPHYGMALAASLVLVIGVPAALIGIRDFEEPRPSVAERAAPTRTESIAAADSMAEVEAATVQSEPGPQGAAAISSPAQPDPNRFRVLPDDEAKAAQPVAATEPVALTPAAPPAPPPPAPALAEVMDADEGSNVVVTGSRVQSQLADRSSESRSEKSAADRAMSRSGGAPDWVLRDRSYADFLRGLQSAVRSGNRSRVVGFVRFPLRVNHAGGAKTYRDAAAVLADYDSIFTSSVTTAILGQRFETLFGRDQGVMIGSGQVWFDHVCRNRSCDPPGPVRITAINP